MKYHKIKNIDKNVCTCEQKLAYNYAQAYCYNFKKAYHKAVTQIQKTDIVIQCRDFIIKQLSYNDKLMKKYDIDSIFCALNSGLENYIKANCPIYASYEDIGNMFPANYLK